MNSDIIGVKKTNKSNEGQSLKIDKPLKVLDKNKKIAVFYRDLDRSIKIFDIARCF